MRPDLFFLGKAWFHKGASPAPGPRLWSPYAAGPRRQSSDHHDAGPRQVAQVGPSRPPQGPAGEAGRLPQPQEAGAGRGPGGGSC